VVEKTPNVTVIGLNYAPEPTGIAPYTSGLATGLVEQGWSVRVVTSFPHYPAWAISAGYRGRTIRENLDGAQVTRLRPYMPKNPSGIKRLLVEVHFGLRSIFVPWGGPDVVVLVSPALFATGIALLRAKVSLNRPLIVVWVQDLYGLGVSETGALGARSARIMSAIESRVLRGADRVVVIHDRFRRYIESELHVKHSAVEVVRNWTHIQDVALDRVWYREHFEWGEEIVVLHAGNMGAKQALENVVEAARLADSSGASIKFVLLGHGNQREMLARLGEGIERLEFMDSLSDRDFQGAMAAADILLVNEKPGVSEMAVPSKLTSYFAAARPIIVATDEGSITAEEIADAEAGVRVDAGDPAALLDASLKLGSTPKRGQVFGASGARFQKRVLSRETAISHYAEIIASLAGARGL
jgi:colanic acid biosynthesis glycosyl transferase WcaI